MPLTEKSLDDIRKEIIEIGTEQTGIRNFDPAGKLMAIWETFARMLEPVYANILNLFTKQITWRSATGFFLRVKALEMGVLPLEPEKTEGVLSVKAYSGGSVEAGKWLKTSSGLRFRTSKEIAFPPGGEFELPVQAEFAGEQYNIIAGTGIRFTSVIQGVESVSVPENWISKPGTDEEEDDSLRARIEAKWDAQGQDNRPSKFELLARNVVGVQDVKVLRAPNGPGSIHVIISATSGVPSEPLLDKVKSEIENSRLVGRDTQVLPITAVPQNFSLTYSGPSTEEEVAETLNAWVLDRQIASPITMKQLYEEALADPSLKIDTFEFSCPTQSVFCSEAGQKILPSQITINGKAI